MRVGLEELLDGVHGADVLESVFVRETFLGLANVPVVVP